ncbi:transporter [Flavobacterium sp. NPDC079362]|uniref:transporter n=1 Tax=Flavobacterium sp. NPDC079362 TaxID=3390566 RepID=UPI003D020D36
MKIFYRSFTFLMVTFYFPFMASAQQMQTDRPNETESPNAVTSHHLQVENGFSFERQQNEKTYEIPQVVMRYGIFKNTEIRVESVLKISDQNQQHGFGITPVIVGFKYHILDHKGVAIPDIGILGRVSIPWMADKVFKDKYYSPEIRLLAQHTLSKTTHLGYNAGVHWLSRSADPEYIYSISADHSLSQKLKLFVETFGTAVSQHHAQNSADVGVLFLSNKNLQFDFMAGTGIMHGYNNKFAELGVSFRI